MMEDNVPGFPGYHVTRSGNVYSRRVERSPNKFRDWHLLKTTLKRNGRVKVVLYRSSKSYTLSLSRLVALIHVYNPNPSITHFIEGSYHKLLGLRISYYNI